MNRYLTGEAPEGIRADIAHARAALDKLEAALHDDTHPAQMQRHVDEVSRWMGFASLFLDRCTRHDEQRRAKVERITERMVLCR
jgi:pyrroloquinoline quinone (PQQ) biosynthesis protein C